MRVKTIVCIGLSVVMIGFAGIGMAQEKTAEDSKLDELNKRVEELQRQFDEMKKNYETEIKALKEEVQQLKQPPCQLSPYVAVEGPWREGAGRDG